MFGTETPTLHLLAKSRARAIQAVAICAGAFVLVLLASAPFRDEPTIVLWSYVALLAVFAGCLKIHKTHPRWAGALVCLGPFVLITGLVAVRGGVTNPPALLAYLTLVVLAALCWGSGGAFVLSALGSLATGGFAILGPRLASMGPLQTWAESSFQLAVVAIVSHVLLRAVDRATAQALRLEAEEHKAHLARLAFEARLLESRSLDALGRLAGGVAHDFNNLLTVVLSSTEYLLRKEHDGSALREDLLRIEDAALRGSKLTRELLAVGGKQVLSPVVLCPRATIAELEPLIRRLIPTTTALKFDLEPDTGNIRVDEARLEQIVLNLVTNAADAMPNGGTITIATKNVTDGPLENAAAQPRPGHEFVELSVTDTGEGMAPDVARRIFEPFFTTKEFGAGTGLGLATVHGIVQQSGGTVVVLSEVGRGTTLSVRLPRTESNLTDRGEPTQGALSESPSAHILLVEDEEEVRVATRRLLESLGHSVTDARNGEEALAALKDQAVPFDVLISDVVMPGLTGPALASLIWQERPSLKVLFISGYPADQLPLSGGLPRQSQYLAKPFGRNELGATLSRMLEVSRN